MADVEDFIDFLRAREEKHRLTHACAPDPPADQHTVRKLLLRVAGQVRAQLASVRASSARHHPAHRPSRAASRLFQLVRKPARLTRRPQSLAPRTSSSEPSPLCALRPAQKGRRTKCLGRHLAQSGLRPKPTRLARGSQQAANRSAQAARHPHRAMRRSQRPVCGGVGLAGSANKVACKPQGAARPRPWTAARACSAVHKASGLVDGVQKAALSGRRSSPGRPGPGPARCRWRQRSRQRRRFPRETGCPGCAPPRP